MAPDRVSLSDRLEPLDPCDGCDGTCGDVCPVIEAKRVNDDRRRLTNFLGAEIARCPDHGLHGERTECFVCGGPVEQVPMVLAEDYDGAMVLMRDEAQRLRAENEALKAERDRAVETRENANTVSARVEAENTKLKADLVEYAVRLATAGSRVNGLRWAMHDADALLTSGMRAGTGEAKERLRSALATDEENNDG